jgi:hypothetical protein
VDPDLLDALNDELFARASWLAGRRVWPSELHIGFPTRDRITIGVPDAFLPDLVMRAAELTDLTGSPLAWFSRMPRVDAWDDHVHACVRRAFMSCGIPLPHFVVMDHDAWHDLVTRRISVLVSRTTRAAPRSRDRGLGSNKSPGSAGLALDLIQILGQLCTGSLECINFMYSKVI